MSDDNEDEGCSYEVTVTKHGPDCEFTKRLRARAEEEGTGPGKWNSKAYVNNWEGVFGKKTNVGQA